MAQEFRVSQLKVEKAYFETRADVMEDVRETGYWPTTFFSKRSPELPVHYHDHDIIGYVMQGETYLLDADERRIEVGPGDRLVIPKGAWHAEGEVKDRMIYIVTVRDPVPIRQAILPREPRGPFPAFDD